MKKIYNNNNKNIKGITLIALVVMIIIILILAAIGTSVGMDSIRKSRYYKSVSEMKVMQTKVNELYEDFIGGDESLLTLGKDLKESGIYNEAANALEIANRNNLTEKEIGNISDYRYYTAEDVKQTFNIEGIDLDFIVNIKSRTVICLDGLKLDGQTYYSLNEIKDEQYNVEYIDPIINYSPNGGFYILKKGEPLEIKVKLTPKNLPVDLSLKYEYAWSMSNTTQPNNWTEFEADDEIKNTDITNEGTWYLWTRIKNATDGKNEIINVCTSDKYVVKKAYDVKVAYTVNHYKQQLDGNFELFETENLVGYAYTSVTPKSKEYTGFTLKGNEQTVTIARDGKTTVDYEYNRNRYDYVLVVPDTLKLNKESTTSGNYYFEYPITINATANEGYTLKKWNVINDSTNEIIASSSNINYDFNMPAHNIKLVAEVSANTYKITLNPGENVTTKGTETIYKTYNGEYSLTPDGNTINSIDIPTKEGYNFDGYYTGENGTGKKIIDKNGNIIEKTVEFTSDTVLYVKWTDATNPVVTLNPNGGTYTMPTNGNATIKTTLTATDEGGSELNLLQYAWSTSKTTEPTTWTTFTNNAEISKTDITKAGTWYLWTNVTDMAGNRADSKVSNAFTVKANTDSTSKINITADPTTWTNGNVTVTISYGSTLTQGKKAGQGTTVENATSAASESTATSITVSTQNNYVYAEAMDAAGNKVTTSLKITNIDKTLPTVTLTPNGGTYTMPTSGNATIKTTLTATDEGESGLNLLQYAWSTSKTTEPAEWTGFTNGEEIEKDDITAAGTWYLWTKVTDNAGNRADSKVSNAFIVKSNTDSTSKITITPNPTTWTNGNVTATITYGSILTQGKKAGQGTTVENATSAATADTATSITVSTQNNYVYAEAMDAAGNKVTTSLKITNIDKTLPTVILTPNGGTYTMPTSGNATIKTTLTATDEGESGLNLLQYAWSTSKTTEPTAWTTFTSGSEISKSDITSAGTWYLWTKVTDKAGNRATNVKISNAFIISDTSEIEIVQNPTEWTNEDVEVTISYGSTLTQGKKAGQGDTIESAINAASESTANNITVSIQNNYVYAEATDANGNKVSNSIKITNIDKTKPTVALSQNGGTYTMPTSGNATIKTTLTATDEGESGLNLLQYAWSTSKTTEPTAWTTFTSGSEISKSDITSAGTWYLWTNVTDMAGNRADSKVSNAFTVKANTDSTSKINITADPTTWTNGNVTVTISYGSTLTQGKKAGQGTTVENATSAASESTATSITVSTQNNYVYAEAMDAAGNKVTTSLKITNIDKTLPTVTLTPNGGTYTMPTSGNATIKTTLTATDEGESELNLLQYAWSTSKTTEPKTWTTFTNNAEISKTDITKAGTWYLWTKVTDNAGNRATSVKTSSAFTVKANTDSTSKINITADPTTWTNGNVTVTITYGSTLKQGKKAGQGTTVENATSAASADTATSITVSTQNNYVYAEAMDAAGNKVTTSLKITNIDKTLPTVTLTPNGGTYTMPTSGNATIKTTLAATDEGESGLNLLQYAWSTSKTTEPKTWTTFTNNAEISKTDITKAGTWYLWTKVTDNAGNRATSVKTSSAFTVKANTDNTSKITITPNPTTWTNGNVTATITYGSTLKQGKKAGQGTTVENATSAASADTATSITVSTQNNYVYAEATDNAGNKVTTSLKITNIDKTLPTVTLTPNGGTYTMPTSGNATIKTTLAATDEGESGLNLLQYAWSTSKTTEPTTWTTFTNNAEISKTDITKAGTWYLWTKVTDNAGNRATSVKTSSAFTVKANTDNTSKITITPNPTTWTNGNVTATITYGSTLTQGKKAGQGTTVENATSAASADTATSITVSTQNNYVYAEATDNAGNKVTTSLKITNIDKTLPTVTLTPNGGTYTMPTSGNATIKTTLTATDEGESELNLLQYAWSTSKTTEPTEWVNFENGNEVSKEDITTAGIWYLWTKVTDNAGNRAESVKTSNAFTVKAKTDNGSKITITADPTTWTNGNVTATITYGSTLTQGKKAGQGTSIENATSAASADTATSITVSTQNNYVYAEAMDAAGNKVTTSLKITNIDKTLPTVTLTPNGGTYTMPTTGNATIKTTLTATDEGGSGINLLQYAWSTSNTEEPAEWTEFTSGEEVDKDNITEAGTWYLWTKVTDNAGNRAESVKTSNAFTVKANTDNTSKITITADPTTWTNGNVTATISYGSTLTQGKKAGQGTKVENATSAASESTATKITVSKQNNYVYAEATDIAGNKVTASLRITNIDKTKPTVKLSPNGGTYTMPTSGNAIIKTTLTATDEGESELNLLQYAWSTSKTTEPTEWVNFENGNEVSKEDITTAGTWYLWTKVTDNAGNRATSVKTSNAFTVKANTDNTSKITITADPTTWTNGNVTATISYGSTLTQGKKAGQGTKVENATSAASESTATKITVSKQNNYVYAEATDIAGNKVTASLRITNIDKTKPTVTLSPNGGTYTMPTSGNATIKTTLAATDEGGSELNLLQYAWSTSKTTEPTEWTEFTTGNEVSKEDITAAGTWYLWTKVTDNAGNRATSVKISNAFTVKANTDNTSKITITPNPTTWTNGNVTVTISYGSALTQGKKAGQGTTVANATSAASESTATSITVSTQNNYVYAEATDANGNKVSESIRVSNIDKDLPTVALAPNGGTYTMPTSGNAIIKTTLTATDEGESELNLLQYAWSTSKTTEPAEWTGFTNGEEIEKDDITAAGTWYLWTKVTDNAGNRATSVKTSSAFTVKAKTDNGSKITITADPTTWTNGNVTATITYGSTLKQGKKAGQGTTVENATSAASESTATSITVSTQNNYVYAEATDNAGNKVTTSLKITNIDKTLPTVTLTPNGGTYTMPTSGNATIKTTLAATDEGESGLNLLQYAWSTSKTTEPKTWTTFTNNAEISKTDITKAGTWYLWTKVTDNAGNRATSVKTSSAFTVKAKTDNGSKITITADPTTWTNGNVTATITYGSTLTQGKKAGQGTTVENATSAASESTATSITVSTQNNYVYAEAMDAAGNKVTTSLKITNIDKTLPTVTLTPNGGTYTMPTTGNATIKTTLTATDEGESELNLLQYAWSTSKTTEPKTWTTFTNNAEISKTDITKAGTWYLWTKVTDNAGNRATSVKTSSAFTVKANTDNTSKITITPNPTTWTNGNVTATITYGSTLKQGKKAGQGTTVENATSAASADTATSITVSTQNNYVYAEATDNAGNKVTTSLKITNIDKTLPTVTLTPNGGTYTMPTSGNATIKTTLTATDEGESGLNLLQYAWSTSKTTEPKTWTTFTNNAEISKTDITKAGTWYLWTKVTDNAGNRATSVKTSSAFTVKAKTDNGSKITITANPTTWTNGNVTATITYGSTLTQGKKAGQGTTVENATSAASADTATSITVSTQNNYVYAEAMDAAGNKVTTSLKITNIDKTLPTVTLTPNGGTYTMPTSGNATIKTTLTATDEGESELNLLQYAWSTSKTTEPKTWTTFTNNAEISKTDITKAGTWYLWTKVTDNAGNRATSVKTSSAFTVKATSDNDSKITIIPSTTNWTNQDVIGNVIYGSTLTEARKAGFGSNVSDAQNAKSESTATTVTATTNGYFYAEATDSAGNLISATLEISNIDKQAPKLTKEIKTYESSDLSDWVLSGGAYIDGEGSLVIPSSDAKAYKYFRTYESQFNPIFQYKILNQETLTESSASMESFTYYDQDFNSIAYVNGWRSARATSTQNGNVWKDSRNENQKDTTAYYTKMTFYWNAKYVKYPYAVRNYKLTTNREDSKEGKMVFTTSADNATENYGASGVKLLKWLAGTKTVNDFKNSGTEFTNRVEFTENGTYTIYVEDNAGNGIVDVIVISGIDKTKPEVIISPNGGTYTMPTSGNATIKSTLTVINSGTPLSALDSVRYAWSQSNTVEPTAWTTFTSGSEISKSDITSAGTWYLWTNVTDMAGNRADSKVSNAFIVKSNTDNTSKITITANPTTWTNGNVTATITYGSTLTQGKKAGQGTTVENATSAASADTATSITVSTQNNYVYAEATDNAGNKVTTSLKITNIDKTLPTVTLTPNGGTYTMPTSGNATIKTTLAATDEGESGLNLLQYAWSTSKTTEPTTWTTFTNNAEISKTDITKAGTWYLWTKVTDNAGNRATSVKTSSAFTVKAKTDNGSKITITADPTTWTNGNVTATITYGSTLKQGKKAGQGTTVENATSAASADTATSITVSTQNNYVYAEATDNAGNKVTTSLKITNIDKTLPTVTLTPNGGTYTMPTSGNATIKTTLAATDEGESGLNLLQYAWSTSKTTEPTTWTTFTNNAEISKTDITKAGTWYLWTKVTDNAGNRADSKVSNAFIVKSNTDNTSKITITPNPTTWTNGNVTATITYGSTLTQGKKAGQGTTVENATSAASADTATSITVSTQNNYVYAEATDNAGNKVTTSLKITNIDKTLPTVTLTPNGGTYTMPTSGNATIKTTLAATDEGESGLNLLQYAWSTSKTTEPTTWTTFTNNAEISKTDITKAGTWYLWTKVTDNAGNRATSVKTSSAFTVKAKTDNGSKITITADPTTWTNGNVTATITYGSTLKQGKKAGQGTTVENATSAASADTATSITVSTQNNYVYAEATDNAGNKVTTSLKITNIDKTLPTVTLTPNGGTYTMPTSGNATIKTTLAATDEGESGLNLLQYAWSTSKTTEPTTWTTFTNNAEISKTDITKAGTWYLWTKVTDNAGNRATSVKTSSAFTVKANTDNTSKITITPNPTTWTNGNVTATITYGSTLKQGKKAGQGTTVENATSAASADTATSITVSTQNNYVYAEAMDAAGNKVTTSLKITNIDKTLPTVTLTPNGGTYTMPTSGNATIKTTLTATDEGESELNLLQYAWSTSKTTEPKTWTTFTNNAEISKTDITKAGTWYLWTKVTDNAGNRATSVKTSSAFTVKAKTDNGSKITITADPTTWTNGNVTATITYGSTLTQGKKAGQGTTVENATSAASESTATSITVSTQNNYVYAEAMDAAGNKVTTSLKITNIDKTLPTVTLTPNGGTYTMPTTGNATIKTTLTATDEGESELNLLQYAWSTSKTTEPKTWTTFTNNAEISKTDITKAGTWYLWTKVTDNAGNRATSVKTSSAFTVKANTDNTSKITITPNPTTWTNGNVTATITYGSTLKQGKKAGQGTTVENATSAASADTATSITVSTQNNYVYAEATDNAGNKVTTSLKITNIDKTLPTVTLTPNGGTYTMPTSGNATIKTTLTATDEGESELNLLQYAWSTSKTTEPKTWTTFTNNAEISKTDITKAGTWYLWTKVTDNAGNRATSVKTSSAFTVKANTDNTSKITITADPTTWTNGNVTATITYGSTLKQGKKAGQGTTVENATSAASADTATSITVSTQNNYVYAEATDNAGNKVTTSLKITNIDKTLPTVTLTPNGGTYTMPTSGNATIKTTLAATDEGESGLNLLQYAWSTSKTTEPKTWTTFTNNAEISKTDITKAGTWYLWTKVTDNAGNRATSVKTSSAFTVKANTDNTSKITITPNPTTWTNGNVTATITYGSTLKQGKKAGQGTTVENATSAASADTATSITVSTQNNYVYAEATDNAGNKVTTSLKITNIDKTLPTVTLTPNGGTYTMPTSGNATIKTTLAATDEGESGLNLLQYAWSTSKTTEPKTWTTFTNNAEISKTDITKAGTWYLWTKVTDNAGNRATSVKTSSAFTVKANTDNTSKITITPNPTTWTNGNVTATITYGSTLKQGKKAGQGTTVENATSAASADTATSITVSTQNNYVYAEATDNAGNKVTTSLKITNIDKTLPTVTLTPNGGTYTMPTSGNATIKTTLAATDEGESGLNLLQYAWSTSKTTEPKTWTTFTNNAEISKTDITKAGTWYLWTKVTDNAGNRATSVKTSSAFTVKANTDNTSKITITPNPTTWTNGNVTATITYGSTLKQGKKAGQGTTVENATSAASADTATSITVSTQNNYVYAEAMDAAGNKVTTSLRITNIDKTKPTVTITRTDYNTFSWKANDTGESNIAGYQITNNNTVPTASDANWVTTGTLTSGTMDIDANTPKTYYVWAKDKAGNVSAIQSIESVKLTKDQGDGTTLTIKADSTTESGGTPIETTCVLTGTPVYAYATANTGYESLNLTSTGATLTDNKATINTETTISSTATVKSINITYNYSNTTFTTFNQTNEYEDTGYIIDWDKDFTITGVYKPNTAGKRYLVIGNYNDGAKTLNIEINTANKIRIYMGSGTVNQVSSTAIGKFNEEIPYTYIWTAATHTYTFTAQSSAANTDISMTGTYAQASGLATKTLRVGNTDYRANGSSTFNATSYAKNLTITKKYVYGENLTIPAPVTRVGYKFNGWYTAQSKGTQVTNSTAIPPQDTTLYAQWEEILLKANALASPTDAFLGTGVTRDKIKKISFSNTLDGHTVNNTDCWDVSNKQNGGVLLWIDKDKTDANGNVEVVIGQDGGVYANPSSGYLFAYIGKTINAEIDLENFDTSRVTNMSHMFFYCGYKEMISLNLGDKFDTSQVTNMSYMFFCCGYEEMISLNLGDKFDTSQVTNMQNMFSYCGETAMTSLDLGDKFNTSQVTNMQNMFSYCGQKAMTSLDLGDKFDTSKVTNMSYMFQGCGQKAMTSLDLGDKFDTSQVTNMQNMFCWCGETAMTSLDLGDKFNTCSVTDMKSMFCGCGKLTVLDVSGFDTSKVTNMQDMFSYCKLLTTLDLSSFDTSNVTDMKDMFYYDNLLKTIYVSKKWNTNKITETNQKIFSICTHLVGGAGTTYSASNENDLTYAHIDEGETNPGYLTYKQAPVTTSTNSSTTTSSISGNLSNSLSELEAVAKSNKKTLLIAGIIIVMLSGIAIWRIKKQKQK